MSGRKRKIVWLYFDEIKNDSRKGTRAKCKKCGKEMEGQVKRMNEHFSIYTRNECPEDEDNTLRSKTLLLSEKNSANSGNTTDSASCSRTLNTVSTSPPSKKRNTSNSINLYCIKTTYLEKKMLDEQIARYIYATNASFRSVEHPQFVQMIQQLRPGYSPPSRNEISGNLLDSIYESEKKKCALILKDEIVCLGLDGWSNIHNEPVICVTVTTKAGETYLVDTIDTVCKPHTSENLEAMALDTIKKCQTDLHCSIRSVVTDNAANVKKMRDMLNENDKLNVITYGCSAHVLHLLAKDIQYPAVKEQLIQIIKYFRNNHFANGCYRSQVNAPKLILPSDTRWNSLSDALEMYIKSWPTLLKICEENRENIDKNIQKLVSNMVLKRNAEDMLEQLKPISVALDKIQKENCTIADAVYIWKDLKKKFTEKKMDKKILEKCDVRYNMALTSAHFLAYLLDPRDKKGLELCEQEKENAMNFAPKKYAENSLLPLIVKFCAKSSPFKKSFFDENVLNAVTPYEWWKSQEADISKYNSKVFMEIEPLLTAKASTASVERMFSTFGLVQSQLRNKLGLQKASKLVFLYKTFN